MGGRKKKAESRRIRAAQAGDRAALELLIHATRPRLEALVLLRMSHELQKYATAEDVVQETYLRAVRDLHRFEWRRRGSFFAWLASIATHVILQLARSAVRDPVPLAGTIADGDALWEALVATATSPPQSLQRGERLARLKAGLERLSVDQREAFLLAFAHGLTTSELAAAMHRTRDAASMLLLRAVRRLRELVGPSDTWRTPESGLETLRQLAKAGAGPPRGGTGSETAEKPAAAAGTDPEETADGAGQVDPPPQPRRIDPGGRPHLA